jgi:hypothetical protein
LHTREWVRILPLPDMGSGRHKSRRFDFGWSLWDTGAQFVKEPIVGGFKMLRTGGRLGF